MTEYERYEVGTRLVLTGEDWADADLLNCEVEVESTGSVLGTPTHNFVGDYSLGAGWNVFKDEDEDWSVTVVPDDAPKTRHIPVFGGAVTLEVDENVEENLATWATGTGPGPKSLVYTFQVVPNENTESLMKRLSGGHRGVSVGLDLGEDPISPTHYQFPSGAQVIDITRYLPFCEANVIKYCARAGRKGDSRLEDLRKAQQYLEWAIENAEKEADND